MQEIKPLTSIRFILAFWILLYHYQDKLWATIVGRFDVVRLGYIAVSSFFILSGFILTVNYFITRDMVNQKQFLISRIARIYPVYLFSLFVAAPYYFYFVLHNSWSANQFILAFGALAITVLLIQSWFAKFALVVNMPAWSISTESFFYLLFPAIGSKLKRQSTTAILLVMAAMLAISLLTSVLFTLGMGIESYPAISDFVEKDSNAASILKYNPLFRIPEFIIGIGLGFLYLNKAAYAKISGSLYLLGFLLSCGVVYALRYQIPFLVAHNTAFIIPSCLLILGLSRVENNSLIKKIMSNDALVFLGKSSYALYLIHQPVLWYMLLLWKFIAIPAWAFALVCMVLSIGCSMLIYQFIEEPCRQKLKSISFDPFFMTKRGFRPKDIFIANKP